jgi:acyl-CoA synthetase (AMP-forming)/AMP-acid ligase II/acyl carrier protein
LLTGADRLHRFPPPGLPFSVVNNYGPTETTVVATSGLVPPAAQGRQGLPTIGRPIANTQAYVLGPELTPVAVGEAGELYVGGAGVAPGYLGASELTAERFVPDPFSDEPGRRLYRTGDTVRWTPDGEIEFLGRNDEQVKILGHRVELGEIEAALASHPDVMAAVVAAPGGADDVPYLVGFVVLRPGTELDSAGLRAYLSEHLPAYMLPARLIGLDALPLTKHGKVDRTALPLPDRHAAAASGDTLDAGGSGLAWRLSRMVAQLLGLERVGYTENFFELGGHSLFAAQLIGQIRDTFGIDIMLHTIFAAPSVAGLAAEVEQQLLARISAMTDVEAEQLLA